MKTIGIVGGGITGLTCAYKLQNDLLKHIRGFLTYTLQEHKKMKDLSVCLSNLYIIRDDFNNLIQPSNKEDILHSIFKGFCVGK